MIYSVVLANGVEDELAEASEWIEEQRSDFGFKFIETYENVVRNLSEYPYSYSLKYLDFRAIKIGRFSYVLIYKIIGRSVLIVRLIHTSRQEVKRYKRK